MNATALIRRLLLTAGAAALLSACTEGPGGAAAAAHPGEDTYNRYCFSCHQAGIAGAPRFGDAEAWAPLIAKGSELLLQTTKTGIAPGMPAMGLCTSCTEQDLIHVIDYMVQAATPSAAEGAEGAEGGER